MRGCRRAVLSTLHIAFVVSLPCDWVGEAGYKLIPYIRNGGPVLKTTGSEQECRDNCLKVNWFICAAFNYKSAASDNCELLAEGIETATATVSAGWSYSTRPSCAGIWQPWMHIAGKKQRSSTKTVKVNLRSCMADCLVNRVSFEQGMCRSIGKSQHLDECYLSDRRSDDPGASLEDSSNYLYLNRPAWYLDDSLGSTNTTVVDRGANSDALYLLISYKVPIDGYAVAWQYHIGHNSTACTSYATIWRASGPNYTLVTTIRLSAIGSENGWTKFRYVYQAEQLVQKGDFLGIHVKTEDTCQGNLISSREDDPADPLAYVYRQPYKINNLSPIAVDAARDEKRVSASIKAYIAGLITMDEPMTVHNASTPANHATVTWTQPDGIDQQYQAGTGYVKIFCSTDSDFHNVTDCQTESTPIEQLKAELTFPDSRTPYYARLYIVRNYNGKELEQRRTSADFYYVNDGSSFCPEKEKIPVSEVMVVDGVSSDTEKYTNIYVSIPSLKDDLCVSSVTLTYGAEVLSGLDKSSMWNVTVDQSVGFKLTVSLVLIDGSSMVTWSRDYPAISGAAISIEDKTAIVNSLIIAIVSLSVVFLLIITAICVYYRRAVHRLSLQTQIAASHGRVGLENFEPTEYAEMTPVSVNNHLYERPDEGGTGKTVVATNNSTVKRGPLPTPTEEFLYDDMYHTTEDYQIPT